MSMQATPGSQPLDGTDRILLIIMRLTRLALFITAVVAFGLLEVATGFIALGVLALTYVANVIERRYRIEIPLELEVFMALFLVASLFLGEVGGFYGRFWWWDLFLHASSAIVFGFVGFLILYVLYYQRKLETSPLIIAIFSFSFAMMIGAVWEIFEFSMDRLFGFNMQRGSLQDTMSDLIVDALGGLLTAGIGYSYINKQRGSLLHRVVRKFLRDNPRFGRRLERKRPSG